MVRSLLFAPANRRELLLKFPRIPADCFVIDLEDGTPPADKEKARNGLNSVVSELRQNKLRGLLYVRVNETTSPHYAEDLKAVVECDIDGLVLPKVERSKDVHSFVDAISEAGVDKRLSIIGGVESINGVLNVEDFAAAHQRFIGFYFGAEDFAADLGIDRSPDGEEVAYARSRIVLAARAAKKFIVDQAVPQIRDLDLFRRDAEKGKSRGYTGKICVTPQQVEMANAIFSPTEQEVAEATRMMAVYEKALAASEQMIVFEGKMIVPEGPLVKRARRILESDRRIRERA